MTIQQLINDLTAIRDAHGADQAIIVALNTPANDVVDIYVDSRIESDVPVLIQLDVDV